jgi:hypothetical protein
MDKTVLVDRDVDDGRRLIEALDQKGFPVVAALWRYLPEQELWRLFIATPVVDEKGPRAAYEMIQGVISELRTENLPLEVVSVVSPKDPLITEFRLFAGTEGSPKIAGIHFVKSTVGEIYVDNAYLYRAERIIGQSGTTNLWVARPEKGRRVWKAYRAKITARDGFLVKVEVEGTVWPQTAFRNGVNIHLGVVTNVALDNGQVFGDVAKWTIIDGRLRSVENVATRVLLEGYEPTDAQTTAG